MTSADDDGRNTRSDPNIPGGPTIDPDLWSREALAAMFVEGAGIDVRVVGAAAATR